MAKDISHQTGPPILNSGLSAHEPAVPLDVLLQGWRRTHWMTAAMSAASQVAIRESHAYVAEVAPAPVQGHRTSAAASELFPAQACSDPYAASAWPQSALAFLDQDRSAATNHASSQGHIDDSAAELLRPLLQQWVNDHLSDVVVKMLRSESARVGGLTR